MSPILIREISWAITASTHIHPYNNPVDTATKLLFLIDLLQKHSYHLFDKLLLQVSSLNLLY